MQAQRQISYDFKKTPFLGSDDTKHAHTIPATRAALILPRVVVSGLSRIRLTRAMPSQTSPLKWEGLCRPQREFERDLIESSMR